MSGTSFYRDPNTPFFELKLYDTSKFSYKKHFHEEYSLGLVDQGASRFWHEGGNIDVDPGSLVLIPPNALHACNPQSEGGWKYRMLFIHPQWVRNLADRNGRPPEFLSPLIQYHRSYRAMVDRMIVCLTGHGSPLEKEASALSVFAGLFKIVVDKKAINHSGRERARLKTVKDYLYQNFLEKVTLDDLEKISGLSKFYLIHLFKAEYNVPPHAYQTLLRVNFAKKELRRQRSIADTALYAGFFDQSHFTKTFKKYVGVTPESYQKSL